MNITRFARKMRDRVANAANANGWVVRVNGALVEASKQGNTVNLRFHGNGYIEHMEFNHQYIPEPAIEGLVPLLFDMQEA